MEGVVRSVQASDGAELRYEVAGDGPPVVLLHGALSSRATFRKVRPHLSGGHRLVLTVLRGHEGTQPVLPADYGLVATEVADLRTILDDAGHDQAGLDRVALVGHSTGGAIAVAFARAHPERVERMVLVEPTLLSLLDETDYQRVLASFEPARRAGRGGDDLTGLWNLLEVMGATTWAGLPDESRQRAFTALQPVAPLVGQHIRALFEFELAEDEVRALPSSLLVYGAATAYFERPIAERLKVLRPDWPQLHVEGAGHNSHVDRPEVVGPVIADFLAG